jgi:hypothetical protein
MCVCPARSDPQFQVRHAPANKWAYNQLYNFVLEHRSSPVSDWHKRTCRQHASPQSPQVTFLDIPKQKWNGLIKDSVLASVRALANIHKILANRQSAMDNLDSQMANTLKCRKRLQHATECMGEYCNDGDIYLTTSDRNLDAEHGVARHQQYFHHT